MKIHVGQEEYVIDERILKGMHYTGPGDLGTIYANVRYTEAVICKVFLLELSLDGTGT